MEQSAKVGGGGTTPSGSPEGSPKPPKAEGSMVTSTGEKKLVSPAGSISSLEGAVGPEPSPTDELKALDLGLRTPGQTGTPPDVMAGVDSDSDDASSPFTRGHLHGKSYRKAMQSPKGVGEETAIRRTINVRAEKSALTVPEQAAKSVSMPYDDFDLPHCQSVPSTLCWGYLIKFAEQKLTDSKDPSTIIHQGLFQGLLNGLPLLFLTVPELKHHHHRLVKGVKAPLRTLFIAFSGADGQGFPAIEHNEVKYSPNELMKDWLVGGITFNDWATTGQHSQVQCSEWTENDLIEAVMQMRMMGFLALKFAKELLDREPHLVKPHWWKTATGRAFAASVACDNPRRAVNAVVEVCGRSRFAALVAEIQHRLDDGLSGLPVTEGLKDLDEGKLAVLSSALNIVSKKKK